LVGKGAPKRPCTARGTRRAPTARKFSTLSSPLPPFIFPLSLFPRIQVSVRACGARSLDPPCSLRVERASRRAISLPSPPFFFPPFFSPLPPLLLISYNLLCQVSLRSPFFARCARICCRSLRSRCASQVSCARLAARNPFPLPFSFFPLFPLLPPSFASYSLCQVSLRSPFFAHCARIYCRSLRSRCAFFS